MSSNTEKDPMETRHKWDFFVAYASQDEEIAGQLYAKLKAHCRVFWAARCLKPGDDWDTKLARSQRQSWITLVLVSSHTPTAYYQRSEIAAAVDLARSEQESHRVIPVFLDGTRERLPRTACALNLKHGLELERHDPSSLSWVVDRLLQALHELIVEQWEDDWRFLLDESARQSGSLRSETTLTHDLVDAIREITEAISPITSPVREAILRLASNSLKQRPHYQGLKNLHSLLEEWIEECKGAPRQLAGHLREFKKQLIKSEKSLAERGAEIIEADDCILLYAHSEAVLAVIEHWMQHHPQGQLKLVLCECNIKCDRRGKYLPFHEAFCSAIRIPRGNVEIQLANDAAAGQLLNEGYVTKVFLGAHQLIRRSCRQVTFKNTVGSLLIATMAYSRDVPIFVFAHERKVGRDESDSSIDQFEAYSRINKKHPLYRQLEEKHPTIELHPFQRYDKIDSHVIPFTVVTEQDTVLCADFDLRKLSSIRYDFQHDSITKRLMGESHADAEHTVRRALSGTTREDAASFRIPQLVEPRPRWSMVRMNVVRGIRLHDLVATLNQIVHQPHMNEQFKNTALEVKRRVFDWAIEFVKAWQSADIQDRLREAFGPRLRCYAFDEKLSEAIAYVSTRVLSIDIHDQVMNDGGSELCEGLRERSQFALRDATLKNQLLALDDIMNLDEYPSVAIQRATYHRPADVQWCDQNLVIRLLNRIRQPEGIEQLRNHIWQVDFESANMLTTAEDDYLHVLGLEIFGMTYAQVIRRLTRILGDDGPLYPQMVLFRCFRAWARRFAYFCEAKDVYRTRYRHESLWHPFNLALGALERLSTDGPAFVHAMRSLMESSLAWVRQRYPETPHP